jgi:hypothetical protein
MGCTGIALLILNLGAKRGVGVQHHAPAALLQGKTREFGWAPGPVWTCVKNLAPTGIRPPHRPARSQSLYRLS